MGSDAASSFFWGRNPYGAAGNYKSLSNASPSADHTVAFREKRFMLARGDECIGEEAHKGVDLFRLLHVDSFRPFGMRRMSLREGTKSVSVDDGRGSRPVMAGVQSALQELSRACGGRDTGSASEVDAVSAGGGERSTRVGQRGRRAARRACCSVSVGST